MGNGPSYQSTVTMVHLVAALSDGTDSNKACDLKPTFLGERLIKLEK